MRDLVFEARKAVVAVCELKVRCHLQGSPFVNVPAIVRCGVPTLITS
jgi:hypothetical protein